MALAVIANYETAIGRPEGKRTVKQTKDGAFYLTPAFADRDPEFAIAYAVKCERYLKFAVCAERGSKGQLKRHERIVVSPSAPADLGLVGIAPCPVVISQATLRESLQGKDGSHAPVDVRTMRRLPELLERPVAVYEAAGAAGTVAVLECCDAQGAPLIARMRQYAADGSPALDAVNRVVGLYGKANLARAIEGAAEQGRLLAVDVRRLERLLAVSGEPLPQAVEAAGSGVHRALDPAPRPLEPPKKKPKGKRGNPGRRSGGYRGVRCQGGRRGGQCGGQRERRGSRPDGARRFGAKGCYA